MKTLKTLCLLLLTATAAFAQPNPDDMFISGYVLDGNGQVQANHMVCVEWTSNTPALPSDSMCTTTNANGYYFFSITNGSVTGPSVDFNVSIDDPCSFLPIVQTVSNGQGSVDIVDLDFVICANSISCDVSITSTNDSINGTWTFVASSTGAAPFTYDWWVDGTSYSTQTVSHMFNGGTVGVFLVVTDANGCQATDGDTLYLGGNPTPCGGYIESTLNPILGTTFEAIATGGSAPYVYSWNTGETTASITAINPGVYCCVITDVEGCTFTTCDTIPDPNQGCTVGITTTIDSTGIGVVYTLTASAGFSSYVWSSNETTQSITVQNLSPNGEVYCVSATDASGCTATACDTLLPLSNGPCQAGFWYQGSPSGILVVTDTVQLMFAGVAGPQSTFNWTLSAGGFQFTATGQNPMFVLPPTLVPINGIAVEICVTVTDQANNCSDTYCETVTAVPNSAGSCDASFTNSGPTPIGYTFSANVQNPNLYYYWEIDNTFVGDGYDAYAPGFTNGTHTICLMVVDSLNNCSDSECITITIGTPNCYGYLSGQVYAGTNNQPLFNGVVYLITFDANTNQLSVVDSIVLDTSNSFFFGPLDCGDYLIKAAAYSGSPYYSNHIPTYHGNSPFWGFAQTLTLTQTNQIVTADVTLIAATNPGGPGFIGGDVTQGANKTDPGDPLSGMQVMIFDLSGNSVAYSYTDGNGEFGFADLAWGTYQVYVEVLGVQTIPAVVTIGPDNPSEEGVHIFASETLISTGIEEFDFEGAISDVYPNPVLDQASITFNLEAELTINVSIVDLTGRTISTEVLNIASGENTLNVSANNLKDGYYFLNIQDVDGNFSVTRKFMRID